MKKKTLSLVPEYVREWFNGYQTTIVEKGITSPEQLVIIDEAGTFIGYGNRRKVAATKGKNAGRAEREEREWMAGPEQWDDGTKCPCGNDVGTGLTENWAQSDTCEAWIHDGCFGLERARDGPYIEQPDSRWQCARCRPASDDGDDGDDSDADHSQPSMAGSNST